MSSARACASVGLSYKRITRYLYFVFISVPPELVILEPAKVTPFSEKYIAIVKLLFTTRVTLTTPAEFGNSTMCMRLAYVVNFPTPPDHEKLPVHQFAVLEFWNRTVSSELEFVDEKNLKSLILRCRFKDKRYDMAVFNLNFHFITCGNGRRNRARLRP